MSHEQSACHVSCHVTSASPQKWNKNLRNIDSIYDIFIALWSARCLLSTHVIMCNEIVDFNVETMCELLSAACHPKWMTFFRRREFVDANAYEKFFSAFPFCLFISIHSHSPGKFKRLVVPSKSKSKHIEMKFCETQNSVRPKCSILQTKMLCDAVCAGTYYPLNEQKRLWKSTRMR